MESGRSSSSSRTPILAGQVESHFHRGFHSGKNRLSIFLLNITTSSRYRLKAIDSGLQVGAQGERSCNRGGFAYFCGSHGTPLGLGFRLVISTP